MSERLDSMVDTRRRAQAVAGLRTLARGPRVQPAPALSPLAGAPEEACDLCGRPMPDDHRHMLDLEARRIVCTCEGCWALRSGEAQFAPVGHRTLWLEGFDLPEEVWASFGIPIGLAFFLHSSVTDCVVAMYPSPAGATESELHFADWQALVARNRVLDDLETDAEALIVNRLGDALQVAIAPIDRAYELVGLIKARWDGHLRRDGGRAGGGGVLRAAARGGDGAVSADAQAPARPVAPEPEFSVLGAAPRRHAALPALEFDVHVREPTGRHVYLIALTAQIMVEPARRRYDAAQRERLVELFGPPERWATTTRSLMWHRADVVVGAFSRLHDVHRAGALHVRPGDRRDALLPRRAGRRGAAGLQLQRHRPLPRRRRAAAALARAVELQRRVPLPRAGVARGDRPLLPQRALDRGARGHPAGAAGRQGAPRGADDGRRGGGAAGRGGAMSETLEPLLDSLLYEGYALYPYTPGATKNATPTPFGIAYPPAYAAALDTAFDHLRVDCLLADVGPRARLSAEVRFLAPTGTRHEAQAQVAALPEVSVAELAATELTRSFSFAAADGPLDVRLRASASPPHHGRARVLFWVENRTPVQPGLDRRRALRRALLSTHPLLRVRDARFVSPLDAAPGCASVNTFPVLASAADDVLLGAAIMLPDHPQVAGESRGSLFDATEIEEALLLHVQALSDAERAAIEASDPTVRRMLSRADAATPDELRRLHGRVTIRDPQTSMPPAPPPGLEDPTRGEPEAVVGGITVRPGSHVVLRPGPQADLHARMAAGRRATIEKILVAYDGRVHLGVTVDGDPGQQLLRETGRLMYFFEPEVEVVP